MIARLNDRHECALACGPLRSQGPGESQPQCSVFFSLTVHSPRGADAAVGLPGISAVLRSGQVDAGQVRWGLPAPPSSTTGYQAQSQSPAAPLRVSVSDWRACTSLVALAVLAGLCSCLCYPRRLAVCRVNARKSQTASSYSAVSSSSLGHAMAVPHSLQFPSEPRSAQRSAAVVVVVAGRGGRTWSGPAGRVARLLFCLARPHPGARAVQSLNSSRRTEDACGGSQAVCGPPTRRAELAVAPRGLKGSRAFFLRAAGAPLGGATRLDSTRWPTVAVSQLFFWCHSLKWAVCFRPCSGESWRCRPCQQERLRTTAPSPAAATCPLLCCETRATLSWTRAPW